jgi:predicted metal-dependent peptidase
MAHKDYTDVDKCNKELEKLVGKWQKILHEESWTIQAFLVPPEAMSEQNRDGESMITLPTETCYIRILNPVYYTGCVNDMDEEEVLVHEMLHIIFAPFQPENHESLEYTLWEQAVDRLARTLVALDRRQ